MKGMYYTNSIIENRKTLTKLCIIFDELCTFEFSSNYYMDELNKRISNKDTNFKRFDERIDDNLITNLHKRKLETFANENHELIEANILNPIIVNEEPSDLKRGKIYGEDELNKEIFTMFFYWGQAVGLIPQDKGYFDSFWYVVNRWRSLYGGLNLAINGGFIPISDNEILSNIACNTIQEIGSIPVVPSLEAKASNLAFKTISLVLPDLPELQPQEILNVRYKLKDELGYFKDEMKMLAANITEEEYDDIDFTIRSKIQPRVDDIILKIKSEQDELFRKIAAMFFIGGSATTLATHFFDLPIASRIVGFSSITGNIALSIHNYKSKLREIKKSSENRGLIFLMDLKNKKY